MWRCWCFLFLFIIHLLQKNWLVLHTTIDEQIFTVFSNPTVSANIFSCLNYMVMFFYKTEIYIYVCTYIDNVDCCYLLDLLKEMNFGAHWIN